MKLMRCEKELERIYGIAHGNNQHTERIGTEFPSKTQPQLAEELGISPKHWRNIKNLEKLAPEIQDLVERGQVTESAVRGLYKVLWFVGKDIAKALGYRDTADSLRRHVDGDDKLTRCFTDSGQRREMYIINESGMYSLILSSKLPRLGEHVCSTHVCTIHS